MKRFIAILLCMLSVLTLFTACGEGEEKNPAASGSDSVVTPTVERIKELDGTVWPLTSQTFEDGTGLSSEDLNSFGIYACISFAGGMYTLTMDTSPVTGDYNVNGDSVELVDAYTLTRQGDTLVLEMGGARLIFTLDPTLVPVGELVLDGTEWELTYMKNDNGVYNADVLARENMTGTFTFEGNTFKMVNNYNGNVVEQSGTYEATKALLSLTVQGEYIYALINGANLIVAESGISMVYTIKN